MKITVITTNPDNGWEPVTSVVLDHDGTRMVFDMEPGVCGKSFAIYLAGLIKQATCETVLIDETVLQD